METGHNEDQTFWFQLGEEKNNWSQCEAFLDALKELVPSADREYDADNKVWTIKEEYLSEFQELREQHFGDTDQLSLL